MGLLLPLLPLLHAHGQRAGDVALVHHLVHLVYLLGDLLVFAWLRAICHLQGEVLLDGLTRGPWQLCVENEVDSLLFRYRVLECMKMCALRVCSMYRRGRVSGFKPPRRLDEGIGNGTGDKVSGKNGVSLVNGVKAHEELGNALSQHLNSLNGLIEDAALNRLERIKALELPSQLLPRLSQLSASGASQTRPQRSSQGTGARPTLKRIKMDINRPSALASSASKAYRLPVQWRKQSTKKNKSWEGDGYVLVLENEVLLKADTKGNGTFKVMGRSTNTNTSGIMVLGQYEAEVDGEGRGEAEVRQVSLSPAISQENCSSITKVSDSKSDTSVASAYKPPLLTTKLKTGTFLENSDPLILANNVVVDPNLSKFLRPHQREGVAFIYEGLLGLRNNGHNGVLLADEMGLGKTLMTITVLWTLLKQSGTPGKTLDVMKVLICCPVTLIDNWRKEFSKWLDTNRIGILTLNGKNQSPAKDKQDVVGFAKTKVYQVLIMGYEKLLLCSKELSAVDFDMLVCDEGHRLKNNNSKVMKLLDSLNVKKRLLLTGTPIQNDLNEFYAIANFINPGIFGSLSEFQRRFAKPILRARDVNCLSKDIIKEGRRVSNELIEITKTFTLRRTHAVISNFLTKKTDVLLFCPPTKLQKSLFKLVIGSSNFNALLDSDPRDALALIMVYRKICNSPSLLAKDSFFNTLLGVEARKQLDPASLVSRTTGSKVNVLVPLLLEFKKRGEKTVLVSNFTQTLDFLTTVLQKLGIQFVRLDGSSAGNTRDKLVNEFQKTPGFRVFLLLAKAGGVGLNLVSASRLVLFDNDWNPSVDLQAMARIHRDGQNKPVYIYRLFTTGCIDEKIFQRQLMKNTLSDMFLDDKTDSSLNIFDFEDLKDLFNVVDTNCNTHDLIDCPCSGTGESFESSQVCNTQETVEDDDLPSLGWMSALDLHKMSPETNAKKQSIRLALSHYRHFDPKECLQDVDVEDDVVNLLLQKLESEDLLTYVFTHVTEGCK